MSLIESLSQLSIARKLWLIVACAALGMVALSGTFLVSERSLILNERQADVQHAVETAHGIAEYFHNLASSGAMPEPDAKAAALSAIRGLRYNGKEYFWVNDLEPRMLMHPFKPELDGQNLRDNKDPAGKAMFVDMAEEVKKNGAGFVYYMWPKPDEAAPVQKVSYVKGFAPWGWVIGSGVYLDNVQATFARRAWIFAAATAVLGALLLAICAAIGRSITRPLQRAVVIANTVASGDLSSVIEAGGRNETGQLLEALKDMNQSLAKTVGEVRTGAETIATASQEIASGNLDLASRTESQASSLEETASSMEELTSTVKANEDNARQAGQLVMSASDVATRGGQVVGQVVETMGSIKDSSRRIADIISVIDGIAFQTNILALNAAVEAARAGEQGRGFAVVAAEVRNLAQRSAAAAKEIKSLIDDSVERVDAGSTLVDEAGKTMGEIVTSVKHVVDIMNEITSASREQSSGIEQVNDAITQMDEMTQQNAALVEKVAAAADSLKTQALSLSDMVSVFKIGTSVAALTAHKPRPALAVVASGDADAGIHTGALRR